MPIMPCHLNVGITLKIPQFKFKVVMTPIIMFLIRHRTTAMHEHQELKKKRCHITEMLNIKPINKLNMKLQNLVCQMALDFDITMPNRLGLIA